MINGRENVRVAKWRKGFRNKMKEQIRQQKRELKKVRESEMFKLDGRKPERPVVHGELLQFLFNLNIYCVKKTHTKDFVSLPLLLTIFSCPVLQPCHV
jgi:hypothetical protein